jgi:hypothetical protein
MRQLLLSPFSMTGFMQILWRMAFLWERIHSRKIFQTAELS